MDKREDKSEQDIGRPEPWGDGRYHQPGKSIDTSVLTPPGEVPNADERPSTPVTNKDYESNVGTKKG